MRRVRFHPEAEAELMSAAAWYEAQEDGLGRRFLVSTQDALNRVQLKPSLYPTVDGGVRRCLIKVFPYGVVFRVLPDVIQVIAIMHLSRDPNYWRDREPNRSND